jgi:hypothetical protein
MTNIVSEVSIILQPRNTEEENYASSYNYLNIRVSTQNSKLWPLFTHRLRSLLYHSCLLPAFGSAMKMPSKKLCITKKDASYFF